MPPFADSNRVSLRFIAEAVWGTTPASGNTRELRLKSSSLAANKETVVSDELRADRMVGSVVEVAATSGGDIEFEFSAGSHDDFMQAVLAGAWSRPMTFDDFQGNVSWNTTSVLRVAGQNITAVLTNNRRIKTEGFLNPANNGYFEISSFTFTGGNTDITVTSSTSVVETASAFTRLMDANDVIILRSTGIALTATGLTGTGLFTSAIAANQLRVGQKIFVETPAGYQTGTLTFSTGAAGTGGTVTVNDGTNSLVFTFAAGTTGNGIDTVSAGSTFTDSATNIAAAINRARVLGVNGTKINVAATVSAGVVTVRNLNVSGGTLSGSATNLVASNFGAAPVNGRGVFTITGLTNDAITVAETMAAIGAGATNPVTIKGSILRNPGVVADITPQSFAIETAFNDVSRFMVQNGLRVGSMSFNAQAGQIVTGTISFMGRQTLPRNTTLLGTGPYTIVAATSTEVMNATSNVGSLVKNGVTLATALQSIEIQIDGGLRNQNRVGSKFPGGIGLGRLNVTGTIQAYFETLEMYTHFINHETISLGFNFQDVEGNYYYFTIPALKINSDPVSPAGIDQDVMEQLEFVAFRDPTTACMLQIDRFSSILPV